jgi:hypothetical protein
VDEMRENVQKRLIGATAGIIIGLISAIYLNQTVGYDIALTTFIVGAPLSTVFARLYGGPLSETMGREELYLTRRVKTVALLIGLAAALTLGYLMGNIVNGIGLGIMLLVTAAPRLGLIFDERMSRVYGKAASNAFAVFSLCSGYLVFYHMEMYPGTLDIGTFIMVLWITWLSLAFSWFYYYISGE